MSDSLVCPVCDTPNDPGTEFCEACGERLLDPVSEAELAEDTGANVEEAAAGLEEGTAHDLDDEFGESEPSPAEFATDAEDDAGSEGVSDEEDGSEGLASNEPDDGEDFGDDAGAEDEAPEDDAGEMDDDGGSEPDDAPDESLDDSHSEPESDEAAPDDDYRAVLYSSVDGQAYYEGSPEFEEGFGPNGEELVPDPPEGTAGDAPEAEPAYAAEVTPPPSYGAGSSEAFASAFQTRQKQREAMEPLPTPGTLVEPATLTLYVNREPVLTHAIETDETLIGRRDPVADAYPDIDLSDHDHNAVVSRKHAYVYRQNRNYTLYVTSHAGTQLNSELLSLGDRRPLKDGDVIVIAGAFAMKFDVPA